MGGASWLVPGIDYEQYVEVGQSLPYPSEYNFVCKQCWPDAGERKVEEPVSRRMEGTADEDEVRSSQESESSDDAGVTDEEEEEGS